ncbi:HD domain-containing protein [Dyadobacter sp. CY261]|uniref:HD domain-containing protein n=1 Tax=Dyadobacter sp. CY261 TaxID=2907203 RepID=UPI001F2BBDCA|nr:HD domain-containing protein [Dyadobacter sp. CY261]MCF0074183.1 HD domain-containing protein [Dyadobacter sp. CY261]
MNYFEILGRIGRYASDLLVTDANEQAYHNIAHTRYVVDRCAEIAHYYQLDTRDSFIVSAAGWFHDLGYVYGQPSGHEKRAVELLHQFGQAWQLDETVLDAVSSCILATILPQKPTNLLESIVCDADLYHLGTTDFLNCDALMRQEVQHRLGQQIPAREWIEATTKLLLSHEYHTLYCQQKLSRQKRRNLQKLQESLLKL